MWRFKRAKRESPVLTEIDADARQSIERRRLKRMLTAISREPSAGERQRLRAITMTTIGSKVGTDYFYMGMGATQLTAENLQTLDLNGYGALNVVGMHCQLVRVTPAAAAGRNAQIDALDKAEGRDPPPLLISRDGESVAGPLLPPADADRPDTMLLVSRDGAVCAIDRVVILNDSKKLVFDGQLCLRKILLSEDERLRINSAQNVHTRPYLEYPTAADEAAVQSGVDIASDEHQRQYDGLFELVYIAFDCLLMHTRHINSNYLQRFTLVHNLTEMPIAQDTTAAFKKRWEAMKAAVAYAGGVDKLQLKVFIRPSWSVRHIRAMMHVVPACLQGIAINGVIVNTNEAPYVPNTRRSDAVLRFTTQPTIDLLVHDNFDLHALNEQTGMTELVSAKASISTDWARYLVSQELVGKVVRFRAESEHEWRPVEVRREKLQPDSLRDYAHACALARAPLDEEKIVKSVATRQEAAK